MSFFRLLPKRFLGIDIGTFAVKVVELSSFAGRIKLENYGEIPARAFYEEEGKNFGKTTLLLTPGDIAKAIKAVLEEAKIETKVATFSLPDFASFFTTFDLPFMTEEEVPQAVKSEARLHIPLPLSEVTLDWEVIDKNIVVDGEKKIKILLVAVPNEIINQYEMVASLSGLEIQALEAEVFSLIRALLPVDEEKIVAIIDIGVQSTTCSIVKEHMLRISHSFDVSGNTFSERIAKSLSLKRKSADILKEEYGILNSISSPEGKIIRKITIPLVDSLVREVEKVFAEFSEEENSKVGKIIVAGGNAALPGLVSYIKEHFKIETELANPFKDIFYPPVLEGTLKAIAPSFSVAVGAALRGFRT